MSSFKRIISILICCVIVFSSIPAYVYAKDDNFVKLIVENKGESGKWEKNSVIGYVENNTIYVPTSFLTEYTLYTFDSGKNVFTRFGQETGSYFGRVDINVDECTATVYQNRNAYKSYKLSGVYNFAEELYLPLDQLTAFLKSYVTVSDNTIRIVMSGYSLVDAEYGLFKLWQEKNLLGYNITNLVDDLYVGDWKIFYTMTIIKYFSTTIFEYKVSNLDVIFNSGNVDKYEKFIEDCITNNDCYTANFTPNNGLIYRMNAALELSNTVHQHNEPIEDCTTLIESIAEPYKDTDFELSLTYKDANDLKQCFKAFNKVTEITDYYLKLSSMCEDNRKILDNYWLLSCADKQESEWMFNIALANIMSKYNPSKVSSLCGKLLELFKNSLKSEINKAANNELDKVTENLLGKKLPVADVVKSVSIFFKICGFDLTDNSEYCATVGYVAKNYFSSIFMGIDNNHFQNSKQTEQYRLMSIIYLLASIQCYENGNGLAKGLKMSDGHYDEQINKINSVLTLFYAAIQSSKFDDFEAIDNIIKNNKNEISQSGILNTLEVVDESYIHYIEPTDEDLQKLVFQLAKYEEGLCSEKDFVSSINNRADNTFYNFITFYYVYFIYFDDIEVDDVIDYNEQKDPLKQLGGGECSYYKLDADKIDWIIMNVFNFTPDRNIRDLGSYGYGYYYYDNSFYNSFMTKDGYGSGWEICKFEKVGNGMYEVTIKTKKDEWSVSFTGNCFYEIKAQVRLKESNDKHYWSFYRINKRMSTTQ